MASVLAIAEASMPRILEPHCHIGNSMQGVISYRSQGTGVHKASMCRNTVAPEPDAWAPLLWKQSQYLQCEHTLYNCSSMILSCRTSCSGSGSITPQILLEMKVHEELLGFWDMGSRLAHCDDD